MGIAMPGGRDSRGNRLYETLTFRELDEDSDRIALGLQRMGVEPGTRLALMVPQSIEFVSLVFAMFKTGAVQILIDPGMGRSNMIHCLESAEPEGFIAIPKAHAVRVLLRHRFKAARFNVTLGRRWFWGGPTLAQFRRLDPAEFVPTDTLPDDPAAIIFTTGSTGPPKGVLYSHLNFTKQAEEIQTFYDIQPGEIDLPGFPLFALFNAAMGVSTVIPDMDPTRPAEVDPENILEAAKDWQVTQAFGSPALWNTVGRYCEEKDKRLPSIRRVLSAGAPVPPHVLKRLKQVIHPDGEIHTPYGATEALPVASNSATCVLGETAAMTAQGRGTCVGHRFPGIRWKIIGISDEPIESIEQATCLKRGEIGELIVQGAVVTERYVTGVNANPLHKIKDGDAFWHRMGDVGYFDEQERFWFCGRKTHRVRTSAGVMYTIPCEAIINTHPSVYRSALVGVGTEGQEKPVIIVEPWKEHYPHDNEDQLVTELKQLGSAHKLTESIEHYLIRESLPVDIRHNAKIFREQLAPWADQVLQSEMLAGPDRRK